MLPSLCNFREHDPGERHHAKILYAGLSGSASTSSLLRPITDSVLRAEVVNDFDTMASEATGHRSVRLRPAPKLRSSLIPRWQPKSYHELAADEAFRPWPEYLVLGVFTDSRSLSHYHITALQGTLDAAFHPMFGSSTRSNEFGHERETIHNNDSLPQPFTVFRPVLSSVAPPLSAWNC